MEPFEANMVFEIIKAPQPLKATRPAVSTTAKMLEYYTGGSPTTYVHLLRNQWTVLQGKSYATCSTRDDGWCEISAFMSQLCGLLAAARYEYSCFANYPVGNITNGVPISKRHVLGGGMGTGLEMRDSGELTQALWL